MVAAVIHPSWRHALILVGNRVDSYSTMEVKHARLKREATASWWAEEKEAFITVSTSGRREVLEAAAECRLTPSVHCLDFAASQGP